MIIVKLKGGLGNQMFQLAAGFALAKFHETTLKLDLSFLEKRNVSTEKFTARPYELDVFQHRFKFANKNDLDFFSDSPAKKINRLKRSILKPIVYQENPFSLDKMNEKTKKNTYLDGYWQSEKYFKKYRNELLNIFNFQSIKNEYQKIEEEIIMSNSISIHFRRGDYANNEYIKSMHGVCDLNYYYKAMEIMNSEQKDINFFIFSDEPRWVEQNFKPNYPFQIVKTKAALSDMYLMSLCKNNIIANSSFSWWGAWLNQNNYKKVIAPQKWFANDRNSSKIIPKTWQAI